MKIRSIRFRMSVWYAAILVGVMVLLEVVVFFGLGRYLENMVRGSLSEENQLVAAEIREHIGGDKQDSAITAALRKRFAPHMRDRYIRVTRADGTLAYSSEASDDGVLDPKLVHFRFARGDEYAAQVVLPDGHRVLVQVLPVTVQGQDFLVESASLYRPVEAVLTGLVQTVALGLPFMLVIALAGGFLLMKRALNPIKDIANYAEQISSRNLCVRLPVPQTGDELERLTVSLNEMMSRLDNAFQHINRFSADVSHELRTPLTILRGELEAAVQEHRLTPQLLEVVGSALEETDRLQRIVDQLLAISRLDAGDAQIERVRLNLGKLTTSTVEQMQLLAEEKSISIEYAIADDVEIEGDAHRLRHVLVNLLDNAIRYTSEGGNIRVAVFNRDGHGVLEVSDNGAGIPAEALPHVFERFYRADKARSRYSGGSGLGLSIVKAICAAHHGDIEIFSTEGSGTRVIVQLPRPDVLAGKITEADASGRRVQIRIGRGTQGNALREG